MRKILLFIVVFVGLCSQSFAQKYGGVAYVTVKNLEGETRVIQYARNCLFSSETEAKENLRKTLEAKKYYNEVLASAITYDVNKCDESRNFNHGGTARVEVKDFKTGKTRFIHTSQECEYSATPDAADAKTYMWMGLTQKLAFNENFISPIEFSINSCKNMRK